MAEQRTNIDIEDVLSSIRRLVSEEPPRPRRADVLMLTPALRVVEGSLPPKSARPAPRSEATSGWPAGLPMRDIPQSTPVRLTDFALPVADLVGAAAALNHGAAPAAKPEASAPLEPAMPADDEIAAFFSSRSRTEISLEERIADLQAAITSSGAEFEPEDAEPAESLAPSRVRRAEDDSRSQNRAAVADPVDAGARFIPAQPRGRIEDAVELGQTEPRGPVARSAQPEPDFEEALIDEDSLREIVGELVRQELRGELGERITRNVRSLIRRELNRALALRDLSDER